MAFGNNRAAVRPRATFMSAGGTTCLYKHAFLTGQIDAKTSAGAGNGVDEVDVSRALRLNDTYLQGDPQMDSAVQEILIDGSTITITNQILAGVLRLNVLRTTGLVSTGDFIACLQFVKASKDNVGGVFTHIEEINGQQIITVFYGVGIKHVPDIIKAGNAVVPYQVQLTYSGWVQLLGSASSVEKYLWAVGNNNGLQGVFDQYAIQTGESASSTTGHSSPITSSISGIDAGYVDTAPNTTGATTPNDTSVGNSGVTPDTTAVPVKLTKFS